MCNHFVSNPRSIASDASVIKNDGTMEPFGSPCLMFA
jgi:hypothetical protein